MSGTVVSHISPAFSSWRAPGHDVPRTAEQLAHALGKARREGKEWRCLCPAHDDRDPSLSISNGDKQPLVFRCRAGCEQPDVIAALVKRGLWHQPRETNSNNGGNHKQTNNRADKKPDEWHPIVPPPANTPPPPPSQLRCDTLHVYRDADGNVLLYVKRIEAKGERKKLFIPVTFGTLNGKTGWHDKHPARPKPLYGLDRLAHAADATVLLVEGEKAADAAQRLFPNYAAMAWMGGAHADSGADLAPLAGRHVVIWPDADDKGRDAGARLAKRLPDAVTLDTAGLPDGFDAADLKVDDPAAWLKARWPQPIPSDEPPTEPPPTDDEIDATIKRIAALSLARYEQVRQAEAKRLHMRNSVLDKLVEAARAADTGIDLVEESRPEVDRLIAVFNGRYAVVNDAGKAMVFQRTYDPVLLRHHFTRIVFDDFRRLYLNVTVQVATDADGKPIKKPAADVWLRHPDRKQFIGGVVFDPSKKNVPDGALNLWNGFAVKPKTGPWSKMQDHLLTIICGTNTDYYDYLLNWVARLVQFPAEQAEVAIVMKGVEGCGKGIFARAIRTILGQHGLAISNPKHLVGAFNAHLRDSVFLFGDECFFAGDKAHIGVLKSLITEPYLAVEAKFHDVVQAPNFLHLMLASNEDWVIPASIESRRFFMLLVPSTRVGDHAYFANIVEEMENGGYEAMLHDLLTRDISAFNPRKVPVTDALIEQRKLSLDTGTAWWMDVLHRGYVFTSKLGLENHFTEWYPEVATDLLFDAYTASADKRRERHPMSRETFGHFMREKVGAEGKRLASATVGEHIIDVKNLYGGTSRKAELIIKPRPPGYSLGPLSLARAAFTKLTGLDVEWPDDT